MNRNLYAKEHGSKTVVTCIGHTHIDAAWLRRYSYTGKKAARSFSAALQLTEQYHGFAFMLSTGENTTSGITTKVSKIIFNVTFVVVLIIFSGELRLAGRIGEQQMQGICDQPAPFPGKESEVILPVLLSQPQLYEFVKENYPEITKRPSK